MKVVELDLRFCYVRWVISGRSAFHAKLELHQTDANENWICSSDCSRWRWSCPCAVTGHHAMKAYWGNGGKFSRILDLSTRWRWVVSFTPRPLYSPGKEPLVPIE